MTNGAQLMSLPEVATYLGMAERTIYVWAQQGKIPAFKLGTSWRFRRSEIDAWLETQRSGPDFSTGRRPLVDPVEPAMTRSMREKTGRDAVEKQITDCVDEIQQVLRVEDKSVWTLEQFLVRFGDVIVQSAVGRLVKDRKIRVAMERGLDGEKVRVIRRRD